MNARTFRIRPSTVHDTFGDETVIVNLDTGSYYSAQGSASIVWRLISDGVSDRTIVDHFVAAYPDGATGISGAMDAFFAQLLEETLVEPDSPANGEVDMIAAAPAKPEAFVAPVLQKYTDMEEMLLLDPVHEVDEQGWPTTRKQLD